MSASMTRQHFRAPAEALKEARPVGYPHDKSDRLGQGLDAVWERVVREVANACQRFNGGFDYQRFYETGGYFPRGAGALTARGGCAPRR